MSKIAEKKVMELGYGTDSLGRNEYSANDVFEAAVECYEQSMQDLSERAEEFLYLQLNNGLIECGNIERLIEQFKNYIQNEM